MAALSAKKSLLPKAAVSMSSSFSAVRTASRASRFDITPCLVFITNTGQPNGFSSTGCVVVLPFSRSKASTGSAST